MKTGFPGFRTVDNNSTARARRRDIFKARDWSLAAKIIHPKGVEWAVKTFKPYKSPGPDGIYSACLQKGLGLLISPLVKVLKAIIALRHMPIVWSGTRVTFIHKPGRNGHIIAKNFRSISLISFILKTLEKLIDSHSRSFHYSTACFFSVLQGCYLRAAIGAMRTTPTEAFVIALCLPLLDRFIISTAKLSAYRLKCQGE